MAPNRSGPEVAGAIAAPARNPPAEFVVVPMVGYGALRPTHLQHVNLGWVGLSKQVYGYLEELLDSIATHDDVVFMTGEQILDWYLGQPVVADGARRDRPSR